MEPMNGNSRTRTPEIGGNQMDDSVLVCPVCGIARTSIIGASEDQDSGADHATLSELPGTALGWIRQKAGWSLQRIVARLNESTGIAAELSHALGPTTVERIERSAFARPVLTRLYRELIGADVFDALMEHGRSQRPAVFAVHGTVTM